MATTAPLHTTFRNKQIEKVSKQRELERLRRLLSLLFSNFDGKIHWTYGETSYTDFNDIYVKYDVQTPAHRNFSIAECRIIRRWHAIHEQGHRKFDVKDAYINWQKEMVAEKKEDWENNEKYPIQWLQFFGNTNMDGRLENFLILDFPSEQHARDFANYEWRFGVRGKNAGQDPIKDFRECFMHRALEMEDIDEWLEEAVELVDSVQPLIEKLRFAVSTEKCLDYTTEIIRKVWSTLLEWMENNESSEGVEDSFELIGISLHDDDSTEWGDPEETKENVKQLMKRSGLPYEVEQESQDTETTEGETSDSTRNSEETPPSSQDEEEGEETESEQEEQRSASNEVENESDASDSNEESKTEKEGNQSSKPKKPDFSQLIKEANKALQQELKSIEEDVEPFENRQEEVEMFDPETKTRKSETINIKELPTSNLERYQEIRRKVSRHILPMSKSLELLLTPERDAIRKNKKSGKLKASQMWKVKKCEDNRVFEKHKKGTPGKDAVIISNTDISGSTSHGNIIEKMREALVLTSEACDKAGVEHMAYAFTEDFYGEAETIIYPLKPTSKLTDREKGYIGGIQPQMSNRDTLVLQWTVNQALKRREDIRLVIMISDGIPIFSPGENEDTMRSIVKKAQQQGVDVLCLFIGNHDSSTINKVEYMYPGCTIPVKDNLSFEMQRHIKRIISNRNA